MRFKVTSILYNGNLPTNRKLDVIFLGNDNAIVYKNYTYQIVDLLSIDLNSYRKYDFILPNEIFIVSIREYFDIENYFIMLSDESIIRINVVEYHGEIMEELTFNKYEIDKNSYYWTIRKWFEEESEEIEIE